MLSGHSNRELCLLDEPFALGVAIAESDHSKRGSVARFGGRNILPSLGAIIGDMTFGHNPLARWHESESTKD